MTTNIGQLIHSTLSGENAQALTAELTQFHRPPGADGYHAATNMVANWLRECGIDDLKVTNYPLDGTTLVGEGPLPLAWEPHGARIQIVSPVRHEVVDMESVSSCLAWWSKPTPAKGIEAELVDLGAGDQEARPSEKDLAGKIALIGHTEHAGGWDYAASQALQRGAVGIISDYLFYSFAPYRTRKNLPDAVQLLRLPNQRGEYDAWGCSISHTSAQYLRELLAVGPVRLHADIRCRIFEGQGQNLIATIRGSELPDESVFFIAHTSAATCPCANCASGPGLMVEIARTLNELIETGQIPRPRRSIRFMFVIEMLGSRVFINEQPDAMSKVKTAFFFDSVGHNQEKLKSVLLFYRHPDSSPSFINDYFAGIMERAPKDVSWVYANDTSIAPVQFVQAPYTPWSDNHVWARYGVPSPLIMSWPDLYFHTQMLSADNTDPRVFRRAGVTTALAAYEIASADQHSAGVIAHEVAARSRFRLETMTNQTIQKLISDGHPGKNGEDENRKLVERAERKLAYHLELAAQAVASSQTLASAKSSQQLQVEIDSHIKDLREQFSRAVERLGRAHQNLESKGRS